MAKIKPCVVGKGIQTIDTKNIHSFAESEDGYTLIWLKPIKVTTTVEELNNEISRGDYYGR
jgi:hypothetical protein